MKKRQSTKINLKNIVTAIAILSISGTLAHANDIHENHLAHADNSIPIPKLESINQLGKLSFTIPQMHRFITDNGVPVLFTPLHELPIVDISVSFASGSSRDNAIKKDAFGIANMVATMLTQGTKKYNEEEFIAQSEQLAIRLNASSDKDTLSVNLRSLSDKPINQAGVQLLLEAITTPTFDKKTLARNKLQTITTLKRKEQNPSYVAQMAFEKALFGKHPYANPTIGTVSSIQKITQADLFAYKNTYLVASNAKITITGDLSLDDAKKIANTLSSALPQGKKSPALPVPKKAKATHIHIDHPANQTSIILGQSAEKINTDDKRMQEFSDLRIGNEILAGGDFNARLMDEIREKKGYTYGIYGNFARMSHAGTYSIQFSTKGELSTNAIKDTLQVVNQTIDQGVRQDELTLSIQNNKNSFPMVFASNYNIHRTAMMLNINDLPVSYLANSLSRYDNATMINVNQALRKHVKPKDFIIISVGKTKPEIK